MSFAAMLSHNVSHCHLPNRSQSVSSFLPSEAETLSAGTRYLLYPLAAGQISAPAQTQITFDGLPAYCLIYTLSGTGTIQCFCGSYSPAAGQPFFFDCSTPYTLSADSAWKYCIIYFNGISADCFREALCSDGPFLPKPAEYMKKDFLALLQACEKKDAFGAHGFLTSILCECISWKNFCENTAKIPPRLGEMRSFIEKSYTERITLTQLESEFSLNKYSLCREFQSCFHVSPIQYLHQVRISHARRLLSTSNLRIQEISDRVGYDNVNLFIRHFQSQTGCTPGTYRKNG